MHDDPTIRTDKIERIRELIRFLRATGNGSAPIVADALTLIVDLLETPSAHDDLAVTQQLQKPQKTE